MLTIAAIALALQAKDHVITVAEKTAIQSQMADALRDPGSATYRWPRARDGIYCFWVNAKNGFGGYTGFKPAAVLMTREPGKPVTAILLPSDEEAIAKTCRDNGYSMPS